MTKREFSGERSLEFSKWIREKLPDSQTGLCVSNQDWLFFNWKTRQLMLAEEKTHNAKIAKWFSKLIREIMNPALEQYCNQNRIDYRGYHFIQFENTSPEDGAIFFDGIEISDIELKQILAFEIYPPEMYLGK